MYIVGLTGGIASGKSTVTQLFAELNVPIIDADTIARELVAPDQPALQNIVASFGEDILNADGTLNRGLLRDKIFSNTEQRQTLEAILHPLIRATMLERAQKISAPYVVLVIPLLVDTGRWEFIDRILVIDTKEDTQLQRLIQRDHISQEQAQAMLNSQISRGERLAAADDILDNSTDQSQDNGIDLTPLRARVSQLHQTYLQYAQANSTPEAEQHPALVYEQPLNERIRILLRLESLFQRAAHFACSDSPHDAHAFINTLVEIDNLTARGDLKSEIMKELERQHLALKRHIDMPGVDTPKLHRLLQQLLSLQQQLHAMQEQIGQHLKADLLYSSVRQRIGIPGGTCDFDLPIYQHWLYLNAAKRSDTLNTWMQPFACIQQAISYCLDCIRNSTDPSQQLANKGYYEQTIESSNDFQLVRVFLDPQHPCYPAISASKHRLNIRFMHWSSSDKRPPQINIDIPFALMLCGI